jgi:hypothetical protein
MSKTGRLLADATLLGRNIIRAYLDHSLLSVRLPCFWVRPETWIGRTTVSYHSLSGYLARLRGTIEFLAQPEVHLRRNRGFAVNQPQLFIAIKSAFERLKLDPGTLPRLGTRYSSFYNEFLVCRSFEPTDGYSAIHGTLVNNCSMATRI